MFTVRSRWFIRGATKSEDRIYNKFSMLRFDSTERCRIEPTVPAKLGVPNRALVRSWERSDVPLNFTTNSVRYAEVRLPPPPPICPDDRCSSTETCTNYTTSPVVPGSCDGCDWVETESCTAGDCITGGECPDGYPRETSRIPGDLRCPPCGPVCGVNGACDQGNPSNASIGACTERTTSAWGPWADDGVCPINTESRTRTCSDGSASDGQMTWDCTHAGTTKGCSGPAMPPLPTCDWSCAGVALTETQTHGRCPCDLIEACNAAECATGIEIVDDPNNPGRCLPRSCAGPPPACTAGADCTTWSGWSDGEPSTILTTETTSRTQDCNSGVVACPCPQTEVTQTENGTITTPCLPGNTICNIYLPGFTGWDDCNNCCSGWRNIKPGGTGLPFDMCW